MAMWVSPSDVRGWSQFTSSSSEAGDQPFFDLVCAACCRMRRTRRRTICCRNTSRSRPGEPVARYWACVEWFDRTCGELLDYLDRKGLRENTIVVYTTDNGWIQNPEKANQFAPRSKAHGLRRRRAHADPDFLARAT